eukprot:366245-Chlamydomonas_euryale.AAC.7
MCGIWPATRAFSLSLPDVIGRTCPPQTLILHSSAPTRWRERKQGWGMVAVHTAAHLATGPENKLWKNKPCTREANCADSIRRPEAQRGDSNSGCFPSVLLDPKNRLFSQHAWMGQATGTTGHVARMMAVVSCT